MVWRTQVVHCGVKAPMCKMMFEMLLICLSYISEISQE